MAPSLRFTLRLDPALDARIERVRSAMNSGLGVDKSRLIRRAIELGLERIETEVLGEKNRSKKR